MFLEDYEYIGSFTHYNYKIELYDTRIRSGLLRRPVYAFQLFYDNRLVYETKWFIAPFRNTPHKVICGAIEEFEEIQETTPQLLLEYQD